METLMHKQISSCPKNTSTLVSMNKNSQTISKPKPKIRIIHIFAPEIIKTDAANFRELVQRLTGKPSDDDERKCNKKKKLPIISSSNKKMEMAVREMMKGEEDIWRSANSGGGFLGGFGDQFDGFMQEMNDQFPFLEGTTQLDGYADQGVQLVN